MRTGKTGHVSLFDALIDGAYDGLQSMPVVFFSPVFLQDPNPGWSVHGTVVKLEDSHVWVLTGHRDPFTGYFEGRWPD